MWRLQLFVLVRMPISAYFLLGVSNALILAISNGWFAALVGVGPIVFMAYISFQLYLFRPGALRLGGILLALEVVGFVLLKMEGDFARQGAFDPAHAFKMLCFVLVVWALPNGLFL